MKEWVVGEVVKVVERLGESGPEETEEEEGDRDRQSDKQRDRT